MIVRSLLVWLVLISAEILHGIARASLLEPQVGDVRARQIGVFTGSLMILAISVAFIRWMGASGRKQLLAVGVLWVALTLSFEILFGRLVLGYSWERLLADYQPTQGGFLALGMIVLALAPLVAARIRRLDTA